MNEKALQSQVTQLAKLYGWRLYHPAVSQFSEPGFPDCVLVRERVLWRELKTDKGRLTPAQSDWLTALRHAGQDAAVWRSVDLTNGVIVQEPFSREFGMSEDWRPVKGYEGIYEVSSEGRIRRNGRVHQPRYDMLGYCRAALTVSSTTRYAAVHRLVAQAFLAPGGPNQDQVNHINGVKDDNRAENLEWVTRSENQRHAVRTGLKKGLPGVTNPRAKLTEGQVQVIRSLVNGTVSASELAKQYHLTTVSIEAIWRGKTWAHLPWPEGFSPLVGTARRVLPHGTWQRYRRNKCRCEPCRDAYNARQRDLRNGVITQELSASWRAA